MPGTLHVVDGKTGEIKTDVDGKPAIVDTTKPPTQPSLIEVPLSELVHDYNQLSKIRETVASKAGYWRGKCKEYDERIAPILAELRRRDDEKHGEQTTFPGIHAAIAAMEQEEPELLNDEE